MWPFSRKPKPINPGPINEAETWMPIPGYRGLYDASSEGRIRSNHGKPHIRATPLRPDGYPLCVLHLDGKAKTWLVHRLICITFHGEQPSPLHEVGHKDGVRANVRKDNLRWTTKKDNQADRIEHGTTLIGAGHPRARLTSAEAHAIIRRRSQGERIARLAADYTVSHNTVRRVVRGQTYPETGAARQATKIKALGHREVPAK